MSDCVATNVRHSVLEKCWHRIYSPHAPQLTDQWPHFHHIYWVQTQYIVVFFSSLYCWEVLAKDSPLLYLWRPGIRIIDSISVTLIRFSFQCIHARFRLLLLDMLESISVTPFSSLISVMCEMDDSRIWWTGQYLWVSLVSTVHTHTRLETSWCWTVLYVLPSKMSLLHLFENLRMVLRSVLFSVFLEDTPQAWNIHGENFYGNEYGTWK
jgi:hypothetical protein